MFVTVNLLVKDGKILPHSTRGQGWLGCLLCSVSLTGMILMAGPKTGCSMNPAITLCQFLL
jgi:hypothetical protein